MRVIELEPKGIFTPEKVYQAAIEKKKLEEAGIRWVVQFHWDVFVTPTFVQPVTDDYAKAAAERFVRSLGESVSAFVAWGGGARSSCHLLINLGAMWEKPKGIGLNRRGLMTRRMKSLWKQGDIQIKPYDARRRGVRYLVDHHEVELIGDPQRHRVRRK